MDVQQVLDLRHGRIIEMGEARQVLTHPQHPYTRELLAAVPSLVPPADQGEVTAPAAKPVLAVTGLASAGGGALPSAKRLSFPLPGSVLQSAGRGTTRGTAGEQLGGEVRSDLF